MAELRERYADAPEIYELDGLSVDYEDWHFNVRPSNTEPLLRLNLESIARTRTWSAGATRCWASSAREGGAGGLVRAEQAGIHVLPIPTPFAVGRVNTYLIEDEPLTLIDSGPNSGKALDELERALRDRGHAIEDLDLLVITHQHIDHTGLIDILARRSGAAGRGARPPRALPRALQRGQRGATTRSPRASCSATACPGDVVQALRSVSRAFRAWGASATVTWPLADGERARAARSPPRGPAPPGPLALRHGVLGRRPPDRCIGGDHLIKHISSNPLISRPLPEPDGTPVEVTPETRPRALMTYLGSLRKTREMPARLVLPGHGEPIADHAALIDERFRLHPRRAEKIHALLAERPRTAYELAQALWGNVAVTQAFLTLSEVLGHVDLLLASQRVREELQDGVARFAPV